MKFNQQILLKHEYGITAQWISDDFSWTAVATYQQNESKKWSLVNCNGPWTGLGPEGKSLTIMPGYEDERSSISSEATMLLSAFNAYIGGKKIVEITWNAPIQGLIEDPEMFVNDKEAEAEGRIQ